jgi:hypothetical protein
MVFMCFLNLSLQLQAKLKKLKISTEEKVQVGLRIHHRGVAETYLYLPSLCVESGRKHR